MPDHVRKQIRDAAVTALTGLASTGERVYAGRTRPLGVNHAASLLVYTRNDVRWEGGDAMGEPPTVGRRCTLVVEGRVSVTGATAAEDCEDQLDQIEAEAVAGLYAEPSLGGLAFAIDWQSSDINVSADGKSHVGASRMEFAVLYRVPENDPTSAV